MKLYKIALVVPGPMTRIEISETASLFRFLMHVDTAQLISVLIYTLEKDVEESKMVHGTTFYGTKAAFLKQENILETTQVLKEDEEDPFTDPPIPDTGTSLKSFGRASKQIAQILKGA